MKEVKERRKRSPLTLKYVQDDSQNVLNSLMINKPVCHA